MPVKCQLKGATAVYPTRESNLQPLGYKTSSLPIILALF
uniref:Uncharacterized protein n=1 Tax=Anguilla anguilla TaxID=7936 RepID=A0A0E9XM98_ANGAN